MPPLLINKLKKEIKTVVLKTVAKVATRHADQDLMRIILI